MQLADYVVIAVKCKGNSVAELVRVLARAVNDIGGAVIRILAYKHKPRHLVLFDIVPEGFRDIACGGEGSPEYYNRRDVHCDGNIVNVFRRAV